MSAKVEVHFTETHKRQQNSSMRKSTARAEQQKKQSLAKEEKESAGRSFSCVVRETVWGSNSPWALKNALLCLYTHSLSHSHTHTHDAQIGFSILK